MAQVLRDAGYTLGIFGKNHCFTSTQLDRWFALNLATESPKWRRSLTPEEAAGIDRLRQWIARQGGPMMPPAAAPFPLEVQPTHLINQRAIDFIERGPESPFRPVDLDHRSAQSDSGARAVRRGDAAGQIEAPAVASGFHPFEGQPDADLQLFDAWTRRADFRSHLSFSVGDFVAARAPQANIRQHISIGFRQLL